MRGETAKCQSCGASIIWAITGNGRPIPINTARVLGGNMSLADGPMKSPIATPITAKADVLAHVTHFATCPNGPKHRKAKP